MIRKQKPQQGEFYVSQDELFTMVMKIKTFLATNKDLVEKLRRMKENVAQNAKHNAPAGAGQSSSQEATKSSGQAGATLKKPAEIKGQGAPVYAPTQSSINLKLPEKKRRPGQAASPSPGPEVVITSVTRPGNKPAANSKPHPAQMHNLPPAPPALPSKCPIPTCPHHVSGFATDAEAQRHASLEHKYTGDALSWMLETVKSALGVAGDTPKLESSNKIGKHDSVKLFATKIVSEHAPPPSINLSLPTAATMSRPPTTTTVKAPVTNQNFKLQQDNTKPGSPSGANTSVKRTAGALGDGTAEGSPSKKPAVTFEDSWTASLVTREAVRDTFEGLRELMQETGKDTPEVKVSVSASQPLVTASDLAMSEKLPLDSKSEHITQPLLSGLPSPPPATWEDTPESVDADVSPKETVKELNVTNNSSKKVSSVDWNPFGMYDAEVDNDYNMDFGGGLDSYELSSQELYQQIFMQSRSQELDLNALIAQQQFTPS